MVAKVNNIDTKEFVLKSECDTSKTDLKNKISNADKRILDTNSLFKKSDLNATITETEGKISSMTCLATNSALTAVENRIPDVSNLVKETDYDAEISGNVKEVPGHDHDKYITT